MNREIKFRGKRKNNGEWVYSHGIYTNKYGNVFMLYERLTLPYSPKMDGYGWVEVIPETVGQYITREDKHNNEIYEGDILEMEFGKKKERFVVIRDNGFWLKNLSSGTFYPISISSECEIIGNVHDNPKLLEEVRE